MEFKVITVKRNLDLAKNYEPVTVGVLKVGLQTINEDVAEIEVQGPEGLTKHSIALGTAATSQGYTFICRDVGVVLPKKGKKRFLLPDKKPTEGVMEAVFDVRWGDQAMKVESPEKNAAYDFMLVRQYEVVADRPMVYHGQDILQFGDLRVEMGDRVEEGSRNYKKPRYAELIVQESGDDPETLQIRLDGKYDKHEGYRIRVTSYDFYNGWYQAYGISIVKGRPKEEIDETENIVAGGIVAEAHTGHSDTLSLSQSRLDEAEADEREGVFEEGESRNIGRVGIKMLKLTPGAAKIMVLSPTVKTTTLVHGRPFDIGRYELSLVGVHGKKAIIRVEED